MGSNPIWGSDFFLCPLMVDSLHLPLFPLNFQFDKSILIDCTGNKSTRNVILIINLIKVNYKCSLLLTINVINFDHKCNKYNVIIK